MSSVSTEHAGKQIVPFESIEDEHIDALRAVLGANIRVALDDAHDALVAGRALLETAGYPITLDLLSQSHLPALSVFRRQNQVRYQGKKPERRTDFVIRYWMDQTRISNLGKHWPVLNRVFEVIAKTLTGDAALDMDLMNEDGEVVRCPTSDLLKLAGFQFVDLQSILGTFDFATSRDGKAGFAYPVLEVSFSADVRGMLDGLPYTCELGLDGEELSELKYLCASIIDGQPDELCRLDAGRPYVKINAPTEVEVIDPSVCLPGDIVEPEPIVNAISINDDGDLLLAGDDVQMVWK